MHPDEVRLAGFLDKTLPAEERAAVEAHISSCAECLKAIVSAHETVSGFRKNIKNKERRNFMNKMNPYLVLTVIFFTLSFFTPRFFIQSLVATLVFGIKWVTDSKSTKMLVMVYDAWKRGGDKEASRVLGSLEKENPGRITRSLLDGSKL